MTQIRLLTAREIECRVAQIAKNGSGLSLLLYKDARCDMAILDETFGSMNWQRHHSRDNANCIISIWDNEKKQWIDKEDTGTESNTEAEKGLASDSFKRAGVNVGIGRELYTAPFIWVNNGPDCEIKKKENGNGYDCKMRFEVSEIGYNEHREINRLVIINSKTHNVVYRFGTKDDDKPIETAQEVGKRKLAQVEAQLAKAAENGTQAGKTVVVCDRCGKPIKGIKFDDGNVLKASDIIETSRKDLNGVYCYKCYTALMEAKDGGGN